MRTLLFFDNVDASVTQISSEFTPDCGQDISFLIQAVKTGTDGDPYLYIEESVDGTVWSPMTNPETCEGFFKLTDTVTGIKDNHFMGYVMRLRLEPNDNTTGTVWAKMNYRTKL